MVDHAIAASARGANPEWLEAAQWVVRRLCSQQESFTADDIWARLKELPGVKTSDHRALGAVIRWAAREGMIEHTGVYRKSYRRVCHGRPMAVWRSVWMANRS